MSRRFGQKNNVQYRTTQKRKGLIETNSFKPFRIFKKWCRRPDLNRHGSPHYPLKTFFQQNQAIKRKRTKSNFKIISVNWYKNERNFSSTE